MTDKTEPALLIADALDCFTNEAMNAAINRQDLTAIAVADALSAGFGGLAYRLRENFTTPAPSGDEVERVARAICRANTNYDIQMTPEHIDALVECTWDLWTNEAKAAIAVLKGTPA